MNADEDAVGTRCEMEAHKRSTIPDGIGADAPSTACVDLAPNILEDPYTNNTILHLRDAGGSIRTMRVLSQLGNTCARVLRVAEVDIEGQESPHHAVLKIFDPRYSDGLRHYYGLAPFDHDRLKEMEAFLDSGAVENFQAQLRTPMSTYDAWVAKCGADDDDEVPNLLGHVLESALEDNDFLDEMIKIKILTKPTSLQVEAFLWEKCRQLCCHEQSIYTLVELHPSMPCPQLLGFLKTCLPSNLSRQNDLSFQFGAILMQHFPGHTLGAIVDLSLQDGDATVFPGTRELLPRTKVAADILLHDMNLALQSMARIGLQTVDYHSNNVFLHALPDGQTTRLKWVDLASFQPLKAKYALNPDFFPLSDDNCFVLERVGADHEVDFSLFQDVSLLTRQCDISPAKRQASFLERYKEYCFDSDSTFAYRVIMESVCFPTYFDERCPSVPLLLVAITATKDLIQHETRISSAETRWARIVVKVNRLLAAEEACNADITQSDANAIGRFEHIVRQSGRTQLLNCAKDAPISHVVECDDDDSDDSKPRVEDDATGSSVSDVVKLISLHVPIFGDFWSRSRHLPDSVIVDALQKRSAFLKTLDLSSYIPGTGAQRDDEQPQKLQKETDQ